MATEVATLSQGKIVITGPYEVTTLRVLDYSLREIAVGMSNLEAEIPPGIYTVQAEIPGDQVEKLVVVESGELVPISISPEDLKFDFSAPLNSARTYRQVHAETAEYLSRHPKIVLGEEANSRLFLYVRQTGEDKKLEQPKFSLQGPTGNVYFSQEVGEFDLEEGWVGLTVDLPFGTYMLEQKVPGLGARGQAIFMEDGWETQVFVPWDTIPNFGQASVYVFPLGRGFDRYRVEYEQTEAALQGMIQGRLIRQANEEIPGFLRSENVMLGLIGCYTLLNQPQVDYDQLGRIADHLEVQLPNSTDARLIRLLANSLGDERLLRDLLYSQKDFQTIFEAPPVLAVGTEYMMRLATKYKDLCSADSWFGRIVLKLTTGSVWTRWDTSADTSAE